MKQDKHIILRGIGRPTLGDQFAGGAVSLAVPPREAMAIRLDVESLDKRDLAQLRRDPEILSIAPSMPVHLIAPLEQSEVNPAQAPGPTWGVRATGAAASRYTGNGITVAVLDTGIDVSHAAFGGVQVVQQDFTGTGDGDGNGHGTHVAGTIFGQEVHGVRFGVAPGVQHALIGKVLDDTGSGSTEQLYQGMLWAANHGAHVISMSLGFGFPRLVALLIDQGWPQDLAADVGLQAYRANVRLFDRLTALIAAQGAFFQPTILIGAAGNDSRRDIDPSYELGVVPPAAADGMVAVGALQTAGDPHNALTVPYFSNTGVNVAAPGVDVYSAWAGGGYRSLNGTSMATPHVAGIAALWAEQLRETTGAINATQLTALVLGRASSTQLAVGVDPLDVGAGLVQAPLV